MGTGTCYGKGFDALIITLSTSSAKVRRTPGMYGVYIQRTDDRLSIIDVGAVKEQVPKLQMSCKYLSMLAAA